MTEFTRKKLFNFFDLSLDEQHKRQRFSSRHIKKWSQKKRVNGILSEGFSYGYRIWDKANISLMFEEFIAFPRKEIPYQYIIINIPYNLFMSDIL